MAYQGITTGTSPNDNTGDSLLAGAVKINSNFEELYTSLGDGVTLNLTTNKVTEATNLYYTDERAQDAIGSAINAGIQTGISVVYDDVNNRINFNVVPAGTSFSGIITAVSFIDGIGNVRSIPQNSRTSAYIIAKSDAGKHVAIQTGGVTLNSSVFSVGDAVTIYNDSASVQMITLGSGVSMRRVSIGDTGSRGLNGYGLATILCIGTNSYIISGAGVT
jgi:hypothetical protein